MGAELKRLGCVVTPGGIDKLFAGAGDVDGVLEMVKAERIGEFGMSSEDEKKIDDIPKTDEERIQKKTDVKDEEDWKYFSQILEAARHGATALRGARDSATREVEFRARREGWGGRHAGRNNPDPERGPYPSKAGLLPGGGDALLGDQSWARTADFSGALDDKLGDLMAEMELMKADAKAAGVDTDAKISTMGDTATPQ